MRFIILLFIVLQTLSLSVFAQKRKVEITQSDMMIGDRYVRKLYGSVGFRHQNALMYCDSAYFYVEDNRFEAYSNVRIVNGDILIYADTLFYDSQESIARLRGKIRMSQRDVVLTTRFLDYNLKENVGEFFNNGKIVDKNNVLTSKIGTYVVKKDVIMFKHKVHLKNKDYTITTDSLQYNTISKIAYLFGPSRVTSKENLLYTEKGFYNTSKNTAQLTKKSYLQSKNQFIYGDTLFYNRTLDVGTAHNNVRVHDTIEKISLHGNKGYFNGKQKTVYLTKKLLLIKDFGKDSLYLHADSLYTIEKPLYPNFPDSTLYREVKAYRGVRFYKSDVQGVCDSLTYNAKDSLLVLYKSPIVWSDKNQITGNAIQFRLIKNQISEMFIDKDAFVIEQDDKTHFNQMRGVSLRGYISNNELYKVDLFKLGETVYFLRDNKEITGINRTECSDISVFLEKGKVKRIVFKTKPVGTLHPPQSNEKLEKLDGFEWFENIRPMDKNDIFKKK